MDFTKRPIMNLDTVRIDLDMDAGTMAYTINGESQVL